LDRPLLGWGVVFKCYEDYDRPPPDYLGERRGGLGGDEVVPEPCCTLSQSAGFSIIFATLMRAHWRRLTRCAALLQLAYTATRPAPQILHPSP
jgi:hypothetical protein